MDNITQLWIRACKVENSNLRLRSVYRRFYCNIEDTSRLDGIIASILVSIVDHINPMTTSEWCREFESFYREGLNYEQKKLCVLVSRLRLTSRDKLVGMAIPLRFRQENK
jgi:hypothetical protein